MLNHFSKIQLPFGKDGMDKPHEVREAVFGIGGVGEVVKDLSGWGGKL